MGHEARGIYWKKVHSKKSNFFCITALA